MQTIKDYNFWRKSLAWIGLASLVIIPLLLLEIHYLLSVIWQITN